MIRLSEGELLDLLPSQMKDDTDMACLSYALKCGLERLLMYEAGTMTANLIDRLPEKILDVLAVELRSPYYMDSMDAAVKRSIIRNTLIWHTRSGTASAVSEMAETVFGEGVVEEWFSYGDDPYYFRVTTNAKLVPDMERQFYRLLEKVKNVRSHIRSIHIHRTQEQPIFSGTGTLTLYKPSAILDGYAIARRHDDRQQASVVGISKMRPGVIREAEREKEE